MRRKKEQPNPDEQMRRTACGLIQFAIQALMKLHGLDRETALHWIVTTAVEATQPQVRSFMFLALFCSFSTQLAL